MVILAPATASFRVLLIGRLLLALLVCCGACLADGITTIEPTGVNTSQGGSLWMNEDGVAVNAYFAGVIDIQLTQNGTAYSRETLCVDLFTDINLNSTYYTWVTLPSAVPPTDPEKLLESVSWLIDNAMLPDLYPQGNFTSALPADYLLNSSTTAAGTGAQRGEALQFAIWDITVDGGTGFSSGRVAEAPGLTDPVVLAAAQFYEAAAFGQATNNAYVYINWSGSVSQVDGTPAQMLEGPLYFDNGPQPTIPEPATLILAGTALLGIGWSWRRRLCKPATIGRRAVV
jgi:hypothetical protein